MRFDIITIFPEAFESYLNTSILKRARAGRHINVRVHDLRRFTTDAHKTVDDKPYGGGPGMVIKLEPLARAVSSLRLKIKNEKSKIILLSGGGKQFTAAIARHWAAKYTRIVMIAGHYEGVDERIKSVIRDSGSTIQEVSIGPYVLTGGELPAMVVVDAVSRHIPGVLGKTESLEEKRLGVGVPMYTRPEVFSLGKKRFRVPKILLSGNHQKISAWRTKHRKAMKNWG